MAARKSKVGDVAEIRTDRRLAYVQCTHHHKDMGTLVRVLPGLYDSRPDMEAVVLQHELYFVFYTLDSAIRKGEVEIVCNLPVPEWVGPEPLMRHASGRTSEGKVTGWRIVPALCSLTVGFLNRTPVIRELTHEQKKLSIHLLRPHPVMVKELARCWTPESAESIEEQDRANSRAGRASQTSAEATDDAISHYLYFPSLTDAEGAGEQLRSRGYRVEVREGADGETWLALARGTRPKSGEEMDKIRDEMESLAAQHRGDYDGWHTAADSLGSQTVH